MQQQFLLWTLYAPMASFGDVAVGGKRPSFTYPTKSSIVGMLSSALGLRRSDSGQIEALGNSLRFAVQVEKEGIRMTDFHTMQSIKQPALNKNKWVQTRRDELHPRFKQSYDHNTVLSSRDYICNAIFTIAVWVNTNSPYSLNDLKAALEKPRFVLYAGRKSCPIALPPAPRVITESTLKDAFHSYTEQSNLLVNLEQYALFEHPKLLITYNDNKSQLSKRVFWEECNHHGFPEDSLRMKTLRRDEPRSRTRWQFGERYEYSAVISNKQEQEATNE